jgi:hypothetical protein
MEAICDFMNCIKCLSQLGGLLEVTNQNKITKIFVRTHFLGGWSSIPWLANKYPWTYCSDVVNKRIAKGPWVSPCHIACTHSQSWSTTEDEHDCLSITSYLKCLRKGWNTRLPPCNHWPKTTAKCGKRCIPGWGYPFGTASLSSKCPSP